MNYSNETFSFFASDVSNYISCKHSTQLQRKYAIENRKVPRPHDPVLEVLVQRGHEHEAAYVNYLRKQNLSCTNSEKKSFEQTIREMLNGTEVIVQGRLEHGEWNGYPDILIRVPGKSKFGDWKYEVQDTKLSLNTRTSAIIQLCFYSDLLENIQGVAPENFAIVMPGTSGQPFTIAYHPFNDFKAYYRVIKNNFKIAVDAGFDTYPEPVEHCHICNWWQICNERRRNDDHLSFVAGLRKSQMGELKKQAIAKLEEFARAESISRPQRGSYENLLKKQKQAFIQYDARTMDTLLHEAILPIEEKRGFNRLPAPSEGDIYLDLEGDAFFQGGSFEYLFGLAFNSNGQQYYKSYWATTRNEEKEAFASAMSLILEQMKKFPDFFIYHYGHYEPTAFKRLAHNYALYEQELDDLLRKGKFIDLHTITKEAIIASVERYSLKDIEKFAKYTRSADLREAGIARKQLERSLQLNEFNSLPSQTTDLVQLYNQDDCLATEALHRWLESERQKLIDKGQSILRPIFTADPPNEKLLELEKRSKLLFESLTKELPADHDSWTSEQKAKWLLANQLQYFRRENKTAWWEHFRMQKAEYDDLIDERKAIVGLKFEREMPSSTDLPIHRYSFPDQETTLREDDTVYIANSYNEAKPYGIQFGTIINIDCENRLVDIKKTGETTHVHAGAIHEYDIINIEKLWTSILNIAVEVDELGLKRINEYRAAKDLLMSRKPQLTENREGATVNDGEEIKDAAIRLALSLNHSILPIQGPPGTGKTYTGAHIIISLIAAKKTVGVTAVSHRVITTLFETVYAEAKKHGITINFVHKVSDKQVMPEWVKQLTDKKKIKKSIESFCVAGGTAWLWADNDFTGALDYLIVDEAGQMSLSQVLAASRAAKNLILLGDPQQLEQPQRGAHPEGSGVAALTHLLDGQAVMPETKGLFLNVTRRINPKIAKFTSQSFYNGKLEALPGLEKQKISGGTLFDGEGLFFVPVSHQGNQNRSDEEIEKVKEIIDDLITKGSWTDKEDKIHRINEKDILVVAPYNAQVDALKLQLKNVDVGTVDKFQGREAPVVIYSMAASTIEDAPRGINFLFNPNRLNVATSRAKCICILIASPTLFEAECNTIEQMKWANSLCLYRELSREIAF